MRPEPGHLRGLLRREGLHHSCSRVFALPLRRSDLHCTWSGSRRPFPPRIRGTGRRAPTGAVKIGAPQRSANTAGAEWCRPSRRRSPRRSPGSGACSGRRGWRALPPAQDRHRGPVEPRSGRRRMPLPQSPRDQPAPERVPQGAHDEATASSAAHGRARDQLEIPKFATAKTTPRPRARAAHRGPSLEADGASPTRLPSAKAGISTRLRPSCRSRRGRSLRRSDRERRKRPAQPSRRRISNTQRPHERAQPFPHARQHAPHSTHPTRDRRASSPPRIRRSMRTATISPGCSIRTRSFSCGQQGPEPRPRAGAQLASGIQMMVPEPLRADDFAAQGPDGGQEAVPGARFRRRGTPACRAPRLGQRRRFRPAGNARSSAVRGSRGRSQRVNQTKPKAHPTSAETGSRSGPAGSRRPFPNGFEASRRFTSRSRASAWLLQAVIEQEDVRAAPDGKLRRAPRARDRRRRDSRGAPSRAARRGPLDRRSGRDLQRLARSPPVPAAKDGRPLPAGFQALRQVEGDGRLPCSAHGQVFRPRSRDPHLHRPRRPRGESAARRDTGPRARRAARTMRADSAATRSSRQSSAISRASRAEAPRTEDTDSRASSPSLRISSGRASRFAHQPQQRHRVLDLEAAAPHQHWTLSWKFSIRGPNRTGFPQAAGSRMFCPPRRPKLPPTNTTVASW